MYNVLKRWYQNESHKDDLRNFNGCTYHGDIWIYTGMVCDPIVGKKI